MSKRSVLSFVSLFTGSLLIFSSAGIAIRNEYDNYHSRNRNERTVEMIDENICKDSEVSEENTDKQEKRENILDMTEYETDGENYIGYLVFESLDVKMPVMTEWSYAGLKTAPCRYYGSVQTHDIVIAGHNYRDGFGILTELKAGDEVDFVCVDGKVYNYTVTVTEILEPTDITAITKSGWDLSMFTCTYSGTQRVTVRCSMNET